MRDPLLLFPLALVQGAAASAAAFLAGGIVARGRWMSRLGGWMYRLKLAALDRWPLSLLKVAWQCGTVGAGCAVLTPLILLKSAGCLVLGSLALAWIPLAMLILPSLFAHSPSYRQAAGRRWVHRVLLLQGGSHLVAAALGTAVQIAAGFRIDELMPTAVAHLPLLVMGSVVWVVLGVAAGWAEAYAHVRVGLLEQEVAGIL